MLCQLYHNVFSYAIGLKRVDEKHFRANLLITFTKKRMFIETNMVVFNGELLEDIIEE